MAQPIVKSYDQILGEALATYMAKIGVTDVNPGSAVLSFFEANAQMTYRATGDVFQILRDFSIDRATGDSLKNLAIEEGVPLRPAIVSTGTVNVVDSSFQKLSSKVYAGTKAPNIGSMIINVGDTTNWPASGQIYVGRNTPNIEGPIAYTSITPIGSYFQINLAAPTLKYHNISESVIVAQGGNRIIPANTIVQTPSIGGASPVIYQTADTYTLLDGETDINNISIVAQQPGSAGNVPANSITEFGIEPFTGATVYNPNPLITGRDNEDDESLRTRIKQTRQSRGLGTAIAIETYTLGAQASDEAAAVTSNNVITSGGKTTLYVDDGTGYERKTAGIGLEFIVDSALGGENSFQLTTGGSQAGVAKAFLVSNFSEPFTVNGGDRLAILVGGDLSEHIFDAADFQANGSATAYEIVTSINSNSSLLFQATTANAGTKVVLQAKEEENEYLQVTSPTTGTDSAPAFNFPSDEIQTLRLYKNDKPLSENGREAFVVTEIQSNWSNAISSGDTLILSVDGTPAITYTFVDQDFVDNTDFNSVSSSNTLASWVTVINTKVTGVTASVDGQSLRLTSNLGINTRASLSIDPSSTLVVKNMFSSAQGLSAAGITKDFIFSRNTGQIKLISPLAAGDRLTAGSDNNLAAVSSQDIIGGTVVLSNPANMWVLVDDTSAQNVGTTLAAGDTISVTKTADTITYTNSRPVFQKVQVGDYVIIWSAELSAANRIEGRVLSKSVGNDAFSVKVTAAEATAAVVESISYASGIAFLRSSTAPQRINIPAGTYNINDLAITLTQATIGVSFVAQDDLRLIVSSNTMIKDEGSVLIVTFDTAAAPMLFTVGQSSISRLSHVAVYETPEDMDAIPYFMHTGFSSEAFSNPPSSTITSITSSVDFDALGLDPNFLVSFLQEKHPFIPDAQPVNETVQVKNLSGTAVSLNDSQFVKRIRTSDYAYAARPYSFGPNDSMVVVLDNDPVNKTFIIPFYRRLQANTTLANNATSFNAYDIDFSPTGSLVTSFGPTFDFSNYKALMKAKVVLDEAGAENAILYRSTVWGKSGEYYKVGYYYPTSANQTLSSFVTSTDSLDIHIILSSGNAITTTMDGTTEWNVTITPNTPVAGTDQVTYTWSGTGSAPSLALSGGEYVTISNTGLFSEENTGTYKVSQEPGFLPSATSFTVVKATGTAVIESNISNVVPTTIRFYQAGADTALDVVNYVTANLTSFVTAELIDDAGSSGAGLILLSTYDSSSFAYTSAPLKDGENWILSSNVSGSPQFTLKRNLSYISDSSYAFNNGEEIRITPTTAKQVVEFISKLAVSGFTTLGQATTSHKEKRFEIGSTVLGSNGGIQVAGGTANANALDVIGASLIVDNNYTKTYVSTSQATSALAGQLLQIDADNYQEKETDISATTTIEILPNTPTVGQATINLGNRNIGERFFNRPRINPTVAGCDFKVEKHGKFVCIRSSLGAANFSIPVNFNVGGSDKVSFYKAPLSNFVEIKLESTNTSNFQEVDFGQLITITNHGDNDGTFRVTGKSDDGKTLQISNPNGVSSTVSATITITNNANLTGDSFTVAGSTKSEGADWAVGGTDAITAANIATALSSISGINAISSLNVITVTATTQSTPISISYNNVGASGATVSSSTLVGEALVSGDLSSNKEIREGDTVIVGDDFAVLNQGRYRVIRQFNDSVYIENDEAVEEEVSISSNTIISGNNASTTFTVVAVSGGVRISATGPAWDLTDVTVGDVLEISGFANTSNDGSFVITAVGSNYVDIANAAFVAESATNITAKIYTPSLKFFDYDTPVVDDTFVMSGDFFGTNQGTYPVVKTLSQSSIVVTGALTALVPSVLGANSDNVFVQEGVKYRGFKEIIFIAAEPSNPNISSLLLSTSDHFDKITEAAGITMSSMEKPNFPSTNKVGIDAYRYDTGLLAEVNKIVYGDPRDRATYPGVSAAGAEIFIDPPLRRRISLGIVVRLQTGVPLAQVIEQVRNSAAALIQANPIGQSIAISNIVSAVDQIPGVRAVSISSPQYDELHDVIVIQPSEKSVIINTVSDISVSQVS